MSSKKTLAVQVTAEDYAFIESKAVAENRTVSSYLRNVMIGAGVLPRCSDTKRAGSALLNRKGRSRAKV